MTGWIVLGVVVVLVLMAFAAYNRLVALSQRVNQAFADIDVQLKQRHDLIPNLVETVKGYAAHERGTLDDVVKEVLTNNPSLKAANENWQAMKERIPQARAWADPRAGFDQRLARFVGVPQNSFTDEKLMIEQTLPVSGRNRFQGDAATADAAGAFEALRRKQLDAIAKTRDARPSQIDRAPSRTHSAAGALGRLPREFPQWKRDHGALHAQSRGCRPCRGRDGACAIALI